MESTSLALVPLVLAAFLLAGPNHVNGFVHTPPCRKCSTPKRRDRFYSLASSVTSNDKSLPLAWNEKRSGGNQNLDFLGFLWSLYIPVYDDLALLTPYQELLQEFANNVPDGSAKILDLGCGTGNVAAAVAQKHEKAEFWGVDTNEKMLDACMSKLPNMHLKQASMNDRLPFPDDFFDVVVCNNVLYLLDDPKFGVSEMFRVVKPGRAGRVLLNTPTDQWTIWPILLRHVQQAGLASVLSKFRSLILISAINLFFQWKSPYKFLSSEEFTDILPNDPGTTVHSTKWTYAQTCLFANRIKSQEFVVQLAETKADLDEAFELCERQYEATLKIKPGPIPETFNKKVIVVKNKEGAVLGTTTLLWGQHKGQRTLTEKYFGFDIRDEKNLSTYQRNAESGPLEIVHFAVSDQISAEISQKVLMGLFGGIVKFAERGNFNVVLVTQNRRMNRMLRSCGITTVDLYGPEAIQKETIPGTMENFFFPGKVSRAPYARAFITERVRDPIMLHSPVIRAGQVSVLM